MGKYVVSPATHPTDCGRFRASFSVRRAHGSGSFRRVFRCETTFASHEGARLFAVTQGWLRACMPHPLRADDLVPSDPVQTSQALRTPQSQI
jgi:hypothetical protein